jgi:hypothetical protein
MRHCVNVFESLVLLFPTTLNRKDFEVTIGEYRQAAQYECGNYL